MTPNHTAKPRPQESGVVLIVAAIVMLGVGVIAVGSMEITLTHATYGATRLDRRAATALAEGGIDVAYQTLNDNPSYRGKFTVTASTGLSAEVTVSENGGNLEIHSVVGVGSVTRAVTAHLAPAPSEDGGADAGETFLVPMETSGRLLVASGQLEVIGGTVFYGQLQERWGGKAVGDFQAGASGSLNVDPSGLIRDAKSLLASSVLESGVYRLDSAGYNSSLTVRTPASLAGNLVVTGHLWVEGSGDLVLGTPEAPLTLVVGGSLDVASSVRSIQVHGLIVAGTQVWIDSVPTVVGTGGMFSNRLSFENTNVTWTFDPSLLTVPNGVTGLPVTEATPTTYAEFWRQSASQ